jgi:TP901 family phage tail tape measure protein
LIKSQIKQLEDSLKLNISYNQEAFKNINKDIDNVKNKISNIVIKDPNLVQLTESYSVIEGKADQLRQTVKITKVATGEYKKLTTDIIRDKDGEISGEKQKYDLINKNNEKIREAQKTQAQIEKQAEQALNNRIASSNKLHKQKLREIEAAQTEALRINRTIDMEKQKTLELQKQLDLYKQQMLGGQGFRGQLDIFASQFKGQYDESSLKKIKEDVESLNVKTPDLNNKMKQLKTQFSSLKQEASGAGTVIMRMLENAYKFLRYYLIGGFFVGIINELKQSIEIIKVLDSDLTEVSMITGLTREQTRDLALEYANLGIEMKKTVAEISTVNKELIRQGLSLEVAKERMEAILKLSATARISTQESLEIITSSVNAMKESAEKTSDILLKAGAVSASSAAQIGEAFTKTASSAKSTGMSIESLTAILSTMIEITQESPSSLGNSMKTLLARFNKINEETGELNEEINAVQEAFESVGVSFLDAEKQIRPVDELLLDLSTRWVSLDKNTKMYIATQAAGVKIKLPSYIVIYKLLNWGKSIKAKFYKYANIERGCITIPCNA